jgi:regulatory protein YycH of two-component signal transduction system YycFG
MRYDLFAKKIELKATSINGSSITRAFLFKFNQPDQYARNIQFGYAVRFDKPFYYRVTEITQDGEATVSDWKQKESWNEIIDITSPPEKIVRKPVVADEQQ